MSRSIIAVATASRGALGAVGARILAEDLAPGRERLVRSDDHRGALVAGGDQREHEVRGFGIEWDVADLVDDDQRDEGEASQLGFEVAVAFGFAEAGDPFGRGRERDALPGETGADSQGCREVRFAGARRVWVELLMLLMFCRSGCGWWRRRGSCVMLSSTCWGGGLRRVRRR